MYLVYTYVATIDIPLFVQMKNSHLRFFFNAVTWKSDMHIAFYLDNCGLLKAKYYAFK